MEVEGVETLLRENRDLEPAKRLDALLAPLLGNDGGSLRDDLTVLVVDHNG